MVLLNQPIPSKVLFPVLSEGEVQFASKLGESLEDRGFSVEFLPKDSFVRSLCKDHISGNRIREPYAEHEPEQSFKVLKDRYGISNPFKLVFPELAYRNQYSPQIFSQSSSSYEEYQQKLHRALEYGHKLYETDSSFLLLQHQGAELLRRCLQVIADKHGALTVWVVHSPLKGHSAFCTSESVSWPSFNPANLEQITEEEYERASGYVKRFRSNTPHIKSGLKPEPSIFGNVQRKARRIRRHGRETVPVAKDWFRDLLRMITNNIKSEYANARYLNEDASRQLIRSEEYVLFTIQYSHESRLTARAPAYFDQGWLIEYLSRSISPNMEFVVKDHPHHPGNLPLGTIEKLAQFASPVAISMDTHDLITNAEAVVTINNDVGFEALMWGKPVVVLGDPFYDQFEHLFIVDNINQLDEVISEAVKSDGLTENQTVQFAHGVLEGSYPGEWIVESPENISKLADSIIQFLHDDQLTLTTRG